MQKQKITAAHVKKKKHMIESVPVVRKGTIANEQPLTLNCLSCTRLQTQYTCAKLVQQTII